MRITLKNYEAYALDFLEGALSPQQEAAFLHFLDLHPEIKEEIDEIRDVVLVPDMEMVYPDKSRLYHKDKGVILPLWGLSRLIAAAVALLLVSTAVFFIWKSDSQPNELITSQQPLDNNDSQLIQPISPATRIPMPEEQPSLVTDEGQPEPERPDIGVMAHQEGVSLRMRSIRSDSPALTSGNGGERTASPSIPVPDRNDALDPVRILNPLDQTPEIADNESVFDRKSVEKPDEQMVLAFLPDSSPRKVKSHRDIPRLTISSAVKMEPSGSSRSDSIKIHIPGEFLSDTWADVNVAKFKKKLLPQFIKNQLNL